MAVTAAPPARHGASESASGLLMLGPQIGHLQGAIAPVKPWLWVESVLVHAALDFVEET
jgi:hypothetical protein